MLPKFVPIRALSLEVISYAFEYLCSVVVADDIPTSSKSVKRDVTLTRDVKMAADCSIPLSKPCEDVMAIVASPRC